jgi:hypothetical protein
MMNKIRTIKSVEFSSRTLALLLTVVLVMAVSSASAKEHKPRGYDAESHVVAHIAFSGLSAVDMAMQRKVNDKYYLYVEHSKDQGISIIDISKPTQPKAVAVIPWPDPDLSSRMSLTGNLAVIAETEILPMYSRTSTDDLVLWDLSNPVAPRVVQKFSGVVKWLQDERKFIYVLNGDGLWVVSEPVDRRPEQTESALPYGD